MEHCYAPTLKSGYSDDYKQLLANYALSAYRMCVDKETNLKNKSFDIRRCYTSILKDMQTPWNVFGPWDYVRPLSTTEKLLPGEYYIAKTFYMGKTRSGNSTILIRNGFYPLHFITYALE